MKAYLLKGFLLLSVILGFLYWLDQRTMMKSDALEPITTDSSSDRGIASVANDEITYDKTVNDLGNPKGPAMSEEAIREEVLRKAAEASHTGYTNADDANNSGFIPDSHGRLSKEQISRYMNILKITMSRLESESQGYIDKQKELAMELKTQTKEKTVSLGSYSQLYMASLTHSSESMDKARKIHAEILLSKNTSPQEYRWIGERVYQAFLLTANAELKKEYAATKAERLKKIEEISLDDYVETENTDIAIFGSSMKESGIDMKERLGKTTQAERFASYQKSQREEINRLFDDISVAPMDSEEIRANGELLQPYKSIFMKARQNYLIIAL